MRRFHLFYLCVCAVLVCCSVARAEDPKSVSLFDGKTLDGWDGDPRFWSVQDGVITGQTTPENPASPNTFLVWRGGTVEDFQLDIDFRLVGGNSGIQYRSKESERWIIGGYQADFDAAGRFSGILYEERGRGIMAMRGKKVEIAPEGEKKEIGEVGDPEAIGKAVKKEDWNHYTIIARGNHLIQKINGLVTVEIIDNQEDKRSMSGLLALQVHQGPPMTVQFKNIQLTRFDTKSSDSSSDEGTALFNGQDLTGWTVVPEDAPADLWTVSEGLLKCQGRPAGYLRTKRDDFQNYVLHVEWRWSEGRGGNNGVLVHASTPNALGVWPKSIEVQLAQRQRGRLLDHRHRTGRRERSGSPEGTTPLEPYRRFGKAGGPVEPDGNHLPRR